MIAPISVDMADAARGLTVQVTLTGQRRFRVRAAIGLALMRFGAWVIGVGRLEVTRE